MVSIGTVLSLLAGGAAIAGAIAVLSNLDKIGGAFTRGVESNITNPFSDYLDNLFKTNGANTQSGPSDIAGQTAPFTQPTPTTPGSEVIIPPSTTVNPDGTVTSDTPPILVLDPKEKESLTDIFRQNKNISELALGQEGFYYFNVAGSKYDTQQFLSSTAAKILGTSDRETLFSPGGLENIKFIGKSALGKSGFQLFGESQNYL